MSKSKLKLKDALQASYLDNKQASQKLAYSGYILDPELSTEKSKTFYNKDNNKLLVAFRGSKTKEDWLITDPMLAIGQIRSTPRYKESKEHLAKSKEKYGVDSATVVGHSLAGAIASSVATPQDTIYTYNKGSALFGNSTKNKPNEKSYTQAGDSVSLFDNNPIVYKKQGGGVLDYVISPYSVLGTLKAHSVNNLENNPVFI